ncbi:hypothetical protein JCM10295v2_006363 [Rhodotorula toruloides]
MVSGLAKRPGVGPRGISDSSVASTASAPPYHLLSPIPDVTTLELDAVPASAPVTPSAVPATNPLLTAFPAPSGPLPPPSSASSFPFTPLPPPLSYPAPLATCPRPKRSNTLASVASSHTRRRQRTHALEALEGRRTTARNCEEEATSGLPVNMETIAELERRALRGVDAAASARGRETRPFLDLEWSSDEGAERKEVQARRSRKIARDEVLPPVPALPKWPPPTSPLPSLPGLGIDCVSPIYRSSPTSTATLSSSSSASSDLTIPAPVARSASSPVNTIATSRPTRQSPPPHLPPLSPLPPLPQLPYCAPPSLVATPAVAPLPPPPQHIRQTSKTSIDSSRSMLSLSSDEEDGASVWEETTRAFPKPPGHGVIAAS